MAKWRERCRVEWDAIEGRNGGAQRTVWEILMEMERFTCRALYCGGGLGDALQLPKKILRVLYWHFEQQRKVHFDGCVAEPLQIITAILPRSKWSCILLRIVWHIFEPPAEIKGLCW